MSVGTPNAKPIAAGESGGISRGLARSSAESAAAGGREQAQCGLPPDAEFHPERVGYRFLDPGLVGVDVDQQHGRDPGEDKRSDECADDEKDLFQGTGPPAGIDLFHINAAARRETYIPRGVRKAESS